jgi:hypothetical protein
MGEDHPEPRLMLKTIASPKRQQRINSLPTLRGFITDLQDQVIP